MQRPMQPKKSIAAVKSDGAAKAEQTTADSYSKRVASDRQNNVQMVQNILLIWLNNNIDDNTADCRTIFAQLRGAINTYSNGEECIQFLNSMGDEKACMIISGSLGQQIVPRIHNMSQVDSIFIFCGKKIYHEQWAKDWSKIKGIFTEIASICEAIKKAAQQCEQNVISISLIATDGDVLKNNSDQLEPTFMYTQIMKEILVSIDFEQKHVTDYIDYCRDVFADSKNELKNVKKLETKYRNETPIWWYTYDCFLYPMLNRALRLMDADIIIQMGFFIKDLHRHIDQLYKEQFDGQNSARSFIVYRGQGMSKSEFEQMIKTKGVLISFNNFLSTSKNRTISLDFANRAVKNPDLVGILFVINIDPAKSTTPFASITDVSYFKSEDEVLFSMHTVFRIDEITPIGVNHRLFQVDLTLTDDNDKDLCRLTDRIREQTYPNSRGWYRLVLVLLKMGQPDKAQQVYEVLLEQRTEDSEKAPIYNQLGWVKDNQGEYKEAITFHEKTIEIYEKVLPPTHPDLASSYTNLGNVYYKMGEFSKAFSSHEKALEIRQQSLPPTHPDFASSYSNIGNVYYSMDEYSKALLYHEKSLEIKQQSLPPTHPDIALSYGHIGNVYFTMGEHSKALPFCQLAVDIGQRTLPATHTHLQCYKNNLEDVKKQISNVREPRNMNS